MIGDQLVVGLFGGMTIRKPKKNDVNSKYYDYDLAEHTIIINDWQYDNTYKVGTGLASIADSILINGRGSIPGYNGGTSEVFCLKPGTKYRFGVVNAGSDDNPIQLTVRYFINKFWFVNSKSVNNNLFLVWRLYYDNY